MKLEDVVDPAKVRVRLVSGYATDAADFVTVGGSPIPAFRMAHVETQEYDPVWVLISDKPDAQSIALVIGVNGTVLSQERNPLTGTVSSAPIGSEVITVSTSAGNVDAAFPETYTPQVADKVRLLWQDGNAWVLGKSSKVPAPPKPKPPKDRPSVSPPPTGRSTGANLFTASDSATWSTGTRSWNSYYGQDVYQGSYPGVGSNRGAWFYHGKPASLRGRRPTKVQVWVPPRASAGNHKATVAVTFYLHSSARRPRGDVNRGSSHTVNIPSGFRGGWRTLPTSWGSSLVSGNGLGIAGGAYAGFYGRKKTSKSGQLRIEWEK